MGRLIGRGSLFRLAHLDFGAFAQLDGTSVADFLFAYTGRPLDPDTGLYDYRARWYDAQVGRFVSEDPLGFAAGDMNTYRYVGNSPLDYTDPTGMSSFSGVLGAVGSALGSAVTSTATSMASGYASAGAYIGGVGAAAIDYSLGTNLVSLGSPTASLPGGGQLVVTGYGGPTPFQQGASAFHTTAAGMSSFSHPASSTQTAATYSPVYAVPTYADAMGLSDADYYRTKLQGAINSNDIAAIDKYSFALANATGADYVDIRMNAEWEVIGGYYEDPNVATQIALAVGKTPDLIVNGPQEAVAWGLTFGGDNQMLVTTVTEAMKANNPDRYWQNYEMINDGPGSSAFYDPALDPNRIVMEPIVRTATDPYMWAGASWMVSGTGPSTANLLDDAAGTAWQNRTRAVRMPTSANLPSTTRLTQPGETYFHYGYGGQAPGFQGGIHPGGFATPNANLSGQGAQSALNLPAGRLPPDAIYPVSRDRAL